jgi:glycosyltransferase involved in cell wall biosynthesis
MWVNECCDEVANRMGVNRIIAVSSQIERVLSQKYGRGKVVQIHNGICLNRVRLTKSTEETRKGLGLTTGRRLIGTVGRLTAVKGHAHFLLAARQLLEDGEDLHFVIVGDGPLLDQLREKAEELGIKDNVMFLGHRDDTYDLLRAMDIFVLPSLHEGIPMVMLEAMALARPVVASRVGGIPEVLTDQVHGLLVSAGNPVELTRACEKFLKNQVLAESCGRAGQMRIEQEFSSEAMGEKVASLYQELVRSK